LTNLLHLKFDTAFSIFTRALFHFDLYFLTFYSSQVCPMFRKPPVYLNSAKYYSLKVNVFCWIFFRITTLILASLLCLFLCSILWERCCYENAICQIWPSFLMTFLAVWLTCLCLKEFLRFDFTCLKCNGQTSNWSPTRRILVLQPVIYFSFPTPLSWSSFRIMLILPCFPSGIFVTDFILKTNFRAKPPKVSNEWHRIQFSST